MRLVVWNPISLFADALTLVFGRMSDVDEVTIFDPVGHPDDPNRWHGVDLLLMSGVPLDDCRQLFERLDLATQAVLVAVCLGVSPDPLFVSRARHFGFADVVSTDAPTESVIDSIREVARVGPPIGSASTWTLDSSTSFGGLVFPHCRDERDLQILQFIVDGHTDSNIAELMDLNAQTIRNRVSNMLLESGMSNRTQLAIDFYRTMLSLRGVDVSLPR